MKLFYAPGACSLSPHIVLREVGLEFDLCKADLTTRRLDDGGDFTRLNPKGYVPALQLDDGERSSVASGH
jgi:glutathione S-transferase